MQGNVDLKGQLIRNTIIGITDRRLSTLEHNLSRLHRRIVYGGKEGVCCLAKIFRYFYYPDG